MKQGIRIIGGIYRGKKLSFPEVQGLRPTPDRVRETLFNWLMHSIKDARCLDAFAGSGALGFEAFSRGAANVLFLEQAPLAQKNLQNTLSQFDSPKLKLIKGDARVYLKQCKENFDLIFLDPPFAEEYLPECLKTIVLNKLLVPGGLVYIESPFVVDMDPNEWKPFRLKQAGQVFYALFEKL